jgi:hypothetical protein
MTGTLPVLALAALLLLAGLFWYRRRRAMTAARRGPLDAADHLGSHSSPRDRLVALSESIRDALTSQFGTSCRAKTTEELSADQRLEQLLGNQDHGELIRFLDQIDHLKFALDRSDLHDEALQQALTAWEPRIATLRDRLRVKPRS